MACAAGGLRGRTAWFSCTRDGDGMMVPMHSPLRRVRIGLTAFALVLLAGTVGYLILGFGLLDALFQTVMNVTTVGIGPVHPLHAGAKAFTIVLVLVGAGTALYTFSAVLEVLTGLFERRRHRSSPGSASIRMMCSIRSDVASLYPEIWSAVGANR